MLLSWIGYPNKSSNADLFGDCFATPFGYTRNDDKGQPENSSKKGNTKMLQFTVLPVTPLRQNSTLIWDDETLDAVLTDVGGDVDYLLNEVAQRKLKLTAVWLTHGHFDHIGGVAELLKKQSVKVYGCHREDAYLFDMLPEIAARYGMRAECFTPNQFLDENDTVRVGNYAFEVLHIPGHTPGSVVYYCAAANLLIAGDVLFYESIGRTDFPRGDSAALLHGITHKLFRLPENTQVITGHGALTTIGHEKQHNPFFLDTTWVNRC